MADLGNRREALDRIRRMHTDEPVEMTNVHAHAASSVLSQVADMSPDQALASAQVHATLALAQEVKNLRLAMYPEGES